MSSTNQKPILVGIAGGTGSGKSTVAANIAAGLPADKVAVIDHDSYYKHHPDMPMDERELLNYDHPDSLDNELFIQHLDALRRCQEDDRGYRQGDVILPPLRRPAPQGEGILAGTKNAAPDPSGAAFSFPSGQAELTRRLPVPPCRAHACRDRGSLPLPRARAAASCEAK